ncbi:MAG TPA: hypothetical protein VJ251_21145, partial [Stellaceae bacterium]|nr:hypothetical protein [Stellaceae bacterium]
IRQGFWRVRRSVGIAAPATGVVLFRVPAPSSDPAGQRLAARIAERDDWNGHFSVVITSIARIGESSL